MFLIRRAWALEDSRIFSSASAAGTPPGRAVKTPGLKKHSFAEAEIQLMIRSEKVHAFSPQTERLT